MTLEAAAVIGPRVDRVLLAALVAEDLDDEACIEAGLLAESDQLGVLVFRHELAREGILGAIPAKRRAALHAEILRLRRARGVRPADLAALVHHAEASNDVAAILELAPEAARYAASLGAHREAASHLERACKVSQSLPLEAQARLHEAFAYEGYLTDRYAVAIEAREEAARIWARLEERIREGDNHRWLSRLHWYFGNGETAAKHGHAATRLLQKEKPGWELAYAYSNEAQLAMLSHDTDRAIEWGQKALRLARRVHHAEIEIHALNNIGTSRILAGDAAGWPVLLQSLELAKAANLHEHVARAYANLTSAVTARKYELAARYLDEGIAYCTERDLDSWRYYLLGWRATLRLRQGRFDEAVADAEICLRSPSGTNRVNPLLVLGLVRARRGDPQVDEVLDEALAIANKAGEVQRLGPTRIARCEAAWLAGDVERARHEAEVVVPLLRAKREGQLMGELVAWLRRTGARVTAPTWMPKTFRAPTSATWRKLGSTVDAAYADLDQDTEESLRRAHDAFDSMGAVAAAARVRERFRNQGIRIVPRGRRSTTRENPFGLTRREVEVLALLAEGATNAAVGKRLFISAKTVDHHVSSLLGKLRVSTRNEAGGKYRALVQSGELASAK
jgi:DNA-binding CsgD family transcriptional regulator